MDWCARRLKNYSRLQFKKDIIRKIKIDFIFQDSGVGTPVTLRVDEHGFYLHWVDQMNEMDLLDIATIRDTRTEKYAKIPKVRK